MKKEFWIPSFLHFFVDFFSVYVLVSFKGLNLSSKDYFFLVLAYDALAFLPQSLFGAIFERSKNLKYLGALGCLLIVIGCLIPGIIAAMILLGIGNSLFHVTIGKIILEKSKKSAPLGVFISFGSIGLGLALTFSNVYLFWSLLGVFMLMILTSLFVDYSKINYSFGSTQSDKKTLVLPLILIVSGVFLRGFFGQYNNYQWINSVNGYSALCLALAIFTGKFLGGFFLDGFGSLPLIILSSLISLAAFFFPTMILVSLLGVFAVNLLMSLTMEYMRNAMPSYTGFGFGLLASFLFLGYLSASYLKVSTIYQIWLVPILILINCGTLIYSGFSLKNQGRIKILLSNRRRTDL
jgi:hypothetical protein